MSIVLARFYKVILVLLIIGFITVYSLTLIYYTNEINERDREIISLKNRVRELESTKIMLTDEVRNLKMKIDELSNYTANLESMNKILENRIMDLNRNIFLLNSRIRQLERDNEILRGERENLLNIVNLRVIKALDQSYSQITLKRNENTSFKYNLEYSGYLYLVLTINESYIDLKISVEGIYINLTYQYECRIRIDDKTGAIILPVLPGYVEITITNLSFKTILIEKLSITYIY
ncbi:MAG: hypothetical protein QXW87_03765 [Desulfurococcaceae archaeon]